MDYRSALAEAQGQAAKVTAPAQECAAKKQGLIVIIVASDTKKTVAEVPLGAKPDLKPLSTGAKGYVKWQSIQPDTYSVTVRAMTGDLKNQYLKPNPIEVVVKEGECPVRTIVLPRPWIEIQVVEHDTDPAKGIKGIKVECKAASEDKAREGTTTSPDGVAKIELNTGKVDIEALSSDEKLWELVSIS